MKRHWRSSLHRVQRYNHAKKQNVAYKKMVERRRVFVNWSYRLTWLKLKKLTWQWAVAIWGRTYRRNTKEIEEKFCLAWLKVSKLLIQMNYHEYLKLFVQVYRFWLCSLHCICKLNRTVYFLLMTTSFICICRRRSDGNGKFSTPPVANKS